MREDRCVFCGSRRSAWITAMAAGACVVATGVATTSCAQPRDPSADPDAARRAAPDPSGRRQVPPAEVEVYGPPPRPVDAGGPPVR
ncbi:MAG TPA: hypothetical protein PLI95_01695 [Polyangiaceae bacterium]|nr:hypothetical protein [Polyangiaceae bacterium]